MTRQVRKPRNIDEALSGQLQTRVSERDIPVPPGVDIYVTDSRCGRYRVNAQTVTVPVWAYNATIPKTKGDPDYAIYYVAHELAHAWSHHDGDDPNNHDAAFYAWFKKLCPAELWHYELTYKTRDAKRAGISPDPAANVNSTGRVPNVVRSVAAPAPTDINELRRAAIKRDPRLKQRLAQLRDDEVKSYVRGWLQLGGA